MHRHPAAPGAIRWRARYDDEGLAIALFDPERETLDVVASRPLLSSEQSADLESWLDRYGIGVESA